ncbi:MAG: hypothetical protein ACLRTQ_01085 [Candidatus Borkfalkia sp.]
MFRITIPMSTPMIFYNLINALIAAMQAFDVYAMVGRGPNDCLYLSVSAYTKRRSAAATNTDSPARSAG